MSLIGQLSPSVRSNQNFYKTIDLREADEGACGLVDNAARRPQGAQEEQQQPQQPASS